MTSLLSLAILSNFIIAVLKSVELVEPIPWFGIYWSLIALMFAARWVTEQ